MLNTSVNIASSEQLYVSTEAKFYNYHTNVQKVPVTFAPTYKCIQPNEHFKFVEGNVENFCK